MKNEYWRMNFWWDTLHFFGDTPWCSGYHYCTTSFIKARIQALPRLKSCSRRVGDSRFWGSLTLFPAGNNAKRLSLVNHTTKHFITSFSTSSTKCSEFDARNMISFQIKVFGRNIKESTLATHFIKGTARHC